MSIIPIPAPATPVRSWKPLRALAAIQQRLDAQDKRAEERNLTITRGRWGRRAYRDPRFDLLALEVESDTAAEVGR